MKLRKTWLCLFTFLVLIGASLAHGASRFADDERAWLTAHPVLKVGTFKAGWPPFEMFADGRYSGMGPDYLNIVTRDLGVRFTVRVYPDRSALLDAMRRGEVDVMTSVAPNPERARYMLFSVPYLETQPVVAARGDNNQIHDESDLGNLQISAVVGSPEALVVGQRLPHAKLLLAENIHEALLMVARRQADAYVGNPYTVGHELTTSDLADIKVIGPSSLPLTTLTFGFPSDRKALSSAFNKSLEDIDVETQARIRSRWLNRVVPYTPAAYSTPLSREERAWLAKLPVLKIGFDPQYQPFMFLEDDGRLGGIAGDYLRLISDRLQLQGALISARMGKDASALADKGEVDVLIAATPQPSLMASMKFSHAYIEFPVVIVTRQDRYDVLGLEDLAGRRIAGNTGAMPYAGILSAIPHATIVDAATASDGLQAVAEGRADAYIGNLAVADRVIRSHYVGRLKVVAPTGQSEPLAVGVRSEYAALVPLINRVLAEIPLERREYIRGTWVATDYEYGVTWATVFRRLAPLALAVLVIVALLAYAYLHARRESMQRRIAEERLADQLQLQVAMMEATPHPMIAKDSESRYTAVNRAFEKLNGVRREDILGKTTQEAGIYKNLEQVERISDINQAAVDRLEGVNTELRFEDALGKVHDILYSVEPFMRSDGSLGGTVFTLVDISEIREEQARRQASEQRLIDVTETLPAVVFQAATHPEGGVAYQFVAGDTFGAFGVSADDVMAGAMGVFTNIHPDDLHVAQETVRRSVETRTPLLMEFRKYIGGECRWLRTATGVPRRQPDGNTLWSGYTVDITSTREAELHARESELLLRDVTSNLPAAVFQFRIESNGLYRFPYVGGKPELIFDVSAAAIMADEQEAYNRIVPEDRPLLREAVQHTVETLDPLRLELRTLVAGQVRWIRIGSGTPQRTDDDAFQWSGYWIDITLEKEQADSLARARDAAEAASVAKANFLAAMSHEIRTPMNGIIGTLELVGHTPLNATQQRMLKTVDSSAQVLLQIIDDILDLSKIEAGRISIERVPFDFRALMDTVFDIIAQPILDKGLVLRVNIAPDLAGEHLGDSVRIRQILLNLLSNATKFTLAGEIAVNLSVTSDSEETQSLSLSVSDTGIGIAKAQQERLFEPFRQADASIHRRFGGTGLGLAITKRLVERMNGAINLHSEPGQGTQIELTLTLGVHRGRPDHAELVGREARMLPDAASTPRLLRDYLTALGIRLVDEQTSSRLADKNMLFVLEEYAGIHVTHVSTNQCIILTADSRPFGLSNLGERQLLSINPLSWGALIAACRSALGVGTNEVEPWAHLDASKGDALQRQASYGAGALILVVDDHVVSRELVQQQLLLLGYGCDAAEDGVEAYRMLSKAAYAMLITDCHMPRMDGYELARRVRFDERGGARRLPIIALTAGVMKEQQAQCLDAGMDDFIAKPVRLGTLHEVTERWLAQREEFTPSVADAVDRSQEVRRKDIIDLTLLTEAYGTGKNLSSVLRALIKTTRTELASFDEIMGSADAKAMSEWVHLVTGGISMLEAKSLVAKGRFLENTLASGYTPKVRAELTAFRDEVSDLMKDAEASLLVLGREA